MKTIAQQLNVKEFPFKIKNNQGNQIYYEHSAGFWSKSEYNSQGNEIYYEDSAGFWYKSKYDSNGNLIYFEDSAGFWSKTEYDSNGNEIYYENSDGKIEDNRPKTELTLDQIAEKFNIPINQLKIKK
jgi:YD repeat-containing protein